MFAPFGRIAFSDLQQIREQGPIPVPAIDADEVALTTLRRRCLSASACLRRARQTAMPRFAQLARPA